MVSSRTHEAQGLPVRIAAPETLLMDLQRIGKYKILEEIGQGTMGKVYKAHDPVLNRFVAVKALSATLGSSQEMHQRFHREAQAAALLSHPNIVTVHDFGEEQGVIYMAMELLEGVDLRAAISESRLQSLDEKLAIMEQVLSGLAFAHAKGVVHRDLKPANIHLQPDGGVKIVDFGLARLSTSEITQDGIVLGTPHYMSPEQALGDKVDARSDIFSAGAVFYELLTGRKPFEADSTPGVLYQVVHKQPAAVRQWAPDMPPILVEVVEKALMKNKNQRFQNARQMRAALSVARQALEGGRGPAATLADESQRALRAAAGRDPSTRTPPVGSLPRVEGTVALDLSAPSPAPRESPRSPLPPTVSGSAPTQVGPRAPRRRPSPAPSARRSGAGGALLFVVALGLAGGGLYYWHWILGQPLWPAGPSAPDPARAEVSALTRALVDTQLQLARRDLDDKNYGAAAAQAERILKLEPGSAEARQLLDKAHARRQEVESAAGEARRAFNAGETQKASQALSRVLELDPRHPVVGELSPQLNRVFRSHAEEAGRASQRSRGEAEGAGAGSAESFTQALSLSREAEDLFRKGEYASATRGFLESRDAFDRARREAKTRPAVAIPAAPPGTATPVAATATSLPSPAPVLLPPGPASPPAASLHRFVTGKTTIGSAKTAGGLAGFDTTDVRTHRTPDFAGRIEFELTPPALKAGEAYTVRVYLVNEGKKTLRIRSVGLTTTINGTAGPASTTSVSREVSPSQRVLLTERPGVWPEGVTSWSLEAVVTSDREETGASRVSWM